MRKIKVIKAHISTILLIVSIATTAFFVIQNRQLIIQNANQRQVIQNTRFVPEQVKTIPGIPSGSGQKRLLLENGPKGQDLSLIDGFTMGKEVIFKDPTSSIDPISEANWGPYGDYFYIQTTNKSTNKSKIYLFKTDGLLASGKKYITSDQFGFTNDYFFNINWFSDNLIGINAIPLSLVKSNMIDLDKMVLTNKAPKSIFLPNPSIAPF